MEEEKSRRGRRILAAVGGGLTALANLGVTLEGAPAGDGADRIAAASERARTRYRDEMDREERRRQARQQTGLREQALDLQRMRGEAAIALGKMRERRMQQTADRQGELAAAREARAERAEQRAEQRAERAAEQGSERADRRKAARPRSEPHRSGFTWIDPGSGEEYTVDRSVWDKSSYTLFRMVVDATRPAADSRGYPDTEEWRRHCFDTYTTAGRRDSYIMRHLPEVPEAMKYLRRMTRK